jgi:hypothetical protein
MLKTDAFFNSVKAALIISYFGLCAMLVES